MRLHGSSIATACVLVALSTSAALSQSDTAATPPTDTGRTEIRNMVARLELAKYKATIKGLTQFGDRRQGTDRNRAAVDWIEAQLKSYGCPTDRIKYAYDPPPPNQNAGRGRGSTGLAVGGGRPRGVRTPTGVNTDPLKQPDDKLRALNMLPTTPGPREAVYCT